MKNSLKRIMALLAALLLATFVIPALAEDEPVRIPPGDLVPTGTALPGEGKQNVYSGPGENYLRPAAGKAAVSAKGWALTFGTEGGWTLIAYQVADFQYRFGWIKGEAVSKTLAFERVPASLSKSVLFTDDPLGCYGSLATLQKGASVIRLAKMGIWAYVEAETEGVKARGFVFSDALTYADNALQYEDCLYPIRVDDKWGYMNYRGQTVLEPQWASAGAFRGAGYAMVGTDADWWMTGHEYSDGIIDRTGAYVVEPVYSCDQGYDGYYYGDRDSGIILYANKGAEGFFNVATGFSSGPIYAQIAPHVLNSRLILVSGMETENWYNSYGYVSQTTGKVVIPYQFDSESMQFCDGWAIVSIYDPKTETSARYLIDETGKRLPLPKGIEPVSYVYGFNDGLLPVRDVKTDLYGYANEQGKVVIKPRFEYARNFWDGVAWVKIGGEERYIDMAGRFVEPPQTDGFYPNAENGDNVMLIVDHTADWEYYCSLMDGEGNILVPPGAGYRFAESYAYGFLDFFPEGLQVLMKDGKYGFLDTKGNEAIPFVWDDAVNFDNGLAWVEKDGKMAYLDHGGNVIWQEK